MMSRLLQSVLRIGTKHLRCANVQPRIRLTVAASRTSDQREVRRRQPVIGAPRPTLLENCRPARMFITMFASPFHRRAFAAISIAA